MKNRFYTTTLLLIADLVLAPTVYGQAGLSSETDVETEKRAQTAR